MAPGSPRTSRRRPTGTRRRRREDDGPGRRWWWFALIALVVVGALIAALLLLRKDQVTVPNVVGGDLATAQATLQRDGFSVDTVTKTAAQPKGQVIGQNPDPA